MTLKVAGTWGAVWRGAAVVAAMVLSSCAARPPSSLSDPQALAAKARQITPAGLARLERSMDGAMLALARRAEGGRRPDLWGRPVGWGSLDIEHAPSLGIGALMAEDAVRLNALLPSQGDGGAPAQPFILRAAGPERERAVLCLTQAVYYEAGLEPVAGQEAVAQTVINRMRHPAFPKSICGVVYQGSERVTGCQFTFTCDGSRERAPSPVYWERARAVAERALDGFVQPAVGTATSYHADYVFPRWGPTLVKIVQIGAHIFYRFPGPAGKPASFTMAYGGGELGVPMSGPSKEALAAARAAGETQLAMGSAPQAPAPGVHDTSPGQVVFGRRVPTKDEIARINASLAAYEARNRSADAPAAAPPGGG